MTFGGQELLQRHRERESVCVCGQHVPQALGVEKVCHSSAPQALTGARLVEAVRVCVLPLESRASPAGIHQRLCGYLSSYSPVRVSGQE